MVIMQKTNFNTGWKFAKQGESLQPVTLPHDAMIHQVRDASNPSGSAQSYFPGGSYIYEKVFTAPVEWEGQHIMLQFEGVYKDAKVCINGKEAGGTVYGYTPFLSVQTVF